MHKRVLNFAWQINETWRGKDHPMGKKQGTFRLVRIGTAITAYVDDGYGFKLLGIQDVPWGYSPVMPWLGVSRFKNNLEVYAEFDNFKINKGRVIKWTK